MKSVNMFARDSVLIIIAAVNTLTWVHVINPVTRQLVLTSDEVLS